MMDAGFFEVLADRLQRLPVPIVIADGDLEVRGNFRLAQFMEHGFYASAASEYEMPCHWQNFIIRVAKLLYNNRVDDQALIGTLKVLSGCQGVKWKVLFRIFGAETNCICDYFVVASECRLDDSIVRNEVCRLIHYKDEFLGC